MIGCFQIPPRRDYNRNATQKSADFAWERSNNFVTTNLKRIALHILCHYIMMSPEEKRDMN